MTRSFQPTTAPPISLSPVPLFQRKRATRRATRFPLDHVVGVGSSGPAVLRLTSSASSAYKRCAMEKRKLLFSLFHRRFKTSSASSLLRLDASVDAFLEACISSVHSLVE
jgi:hypothetical protein